MASIIAKNYANALFTVARKKMKVEAFKFELIDAKDIYIQNEDLRKLISHPDVLKEDKISIINKIFDGDKDIVSFLKVLVDNDRFSSLPEINDVFENLSNEELGIEVVKVVSAIKLNQEEINSIKSMLENRLDKKVELREVIDPSCLAGIRIVLKDEILDNTIDTKLNNIKSMISRVSI